MTGAGVTGGGPAEGRRRVYVAGAFDIRNYGDLLFPLLAARRLGPLGYEVAPVTPAGGASGWADALPCRPLAEVVADPSDAAGFLVGGGNILYAGVSGDHLLRAPPRGSAGGPVAAWGPAALWLGPTLAAALADVPVLWNAPGVPHPVPAGLWQDLLADAARASDHAAVRDGASLGMMGPAAAAHALVVPDTALDLPRLWPRAALRPLAERLRAGGGLPAGQRTWAVHVRAASMGGAAPADLAAAIDATSRATGLAPVLLAIGPDLGDGEVARALSRHLAGPHLALDAPEGPRAIAALIADAELYVGASLHGYVTAAAYGVPARLVARPAFRKHAGLLAHLGREGDLARDWRAALDAAPAAAGAGPGPGLPAAALDRIDRHWEAVAEALATPGRRRAERLDFLRALVRRGLGRGGSAAWLLGPFCGGRAPGRAA